MHHIANLCYRFPILKFPPPPFAVLLVLYLYHIIDTDEIMVQQLARQNQVTKYQTVQILYVQPKTQQNQIRDMDEGVLQHDPQNAPLHCCEITRDT